MQEKNGAGANFFLLLALYDTVSLGAGLGSGGDPRPSRVLGPERAPPGGRLCDGRLPKVLRLGPVPPDPGGGEALLAFQARP
jgi:hypothetical protein